jgi:hypothetical protein
MTDPAGALTRSVRTIGVVASVAIVVAAITRAVATNYYGWMAYDGMASIAAGSARGADRDRMMTNLVASLGTLALAGVLLLVAAAVFLTWLYRARVNSEAISPATPQPARGWTVGGWFVPVANLVLAPMIVMAVSRASSPSRHDRSTGLVAGWWLAFLASWSVALIAGQYRDQGKAARSLDPYLTAAVLNTVESVLILASAGLLAAIILRISRWQEDQLGAPDRTDPGAGAALPPADRRSDPLVAAGFVGWLAVVAGVVRRSFGKLALLYLVGLAVALFLLVGVGSLFDDSGAGTGYDSSTGLYWESGNLGASVVLRLVLLFLALPAEVLIVGAACFVVIRQAAGRSAGLGDALRFAAGRVWPATGWTAVAFVAYFAGVVLLVLPGLYVLIAMCVLPGVLFVGRGHLGRAFSLVSRHFPVALGRALCVGLPGLVYLLLTMVVLQAAGVGSGTAVGVTLELVIGLPLGVYWFAATTATYAELRGREHPGTTARTLADEMLGERTTADTVSVSTLPPAAAPPAVGGGARRPVRMAGTTATMLIVLAAVTWLATAILNTTAGPGVATTVAQVISLIGYVGAIVMFLIWLTRARANAERAVPGSQRLSAGWAVGGWFVPVANLVLPFRAVSDLWRASCPARGATLVVAWWAVFVTAYVCSISALVVSSGPAASVLSVLDGLLTVVAAGLIAVVIAQVSTAQEPRPPAGSPADVRTRRLVAGFLAVMVVLAATLTVLLGADLPARLGSGAAGAPAASGYGPAGRWVGTYHCYQGETDLELEITDTGRGDLEAVFRFGVDSAMPAMRSGSFRMRGNTDGTKVWLTGAAWIDRPPGYQMVDLIGRLGADRPSTTLSGTVSGSGCTFFQLTRQP